MLTKASEANRYSYRQSVKLLVQVVVPPARLQVVAFPQSELAATGSDLAGGSFCFQLSGGLKTPRIFDLANTKHEGQSTVITSRPHLDK